MVKLNLIRESVFEVLLRELEKVKRAVKRHDWDTAERILRAVYRRIWGKEIA